MRPFPTGIEAGRDKGSVSFDLDVQTNLTTLFQSTLSDGTETMQAKIVRISLLIPSVAAMGQVALSGSGMFVIANVFCDSGPLQKCFRASLLFLGAGTMVAVRVLPAIIALVSVRGRPFWYLNVYPVALMLQGGIAMHWHRFLPAVSTRVALMCGVMALLTCGHLFLSRPSGKAQNRSQSAI